MPPFAVLLLLLAGTPEEVFREGRRLMQEGRVAEACAAFDESHRRDPALGALINLAECEALLGHDARAWSLFQEVLAWSRRTKHAEREQVALARLKELAARVALVVIDEGPDATATIDGQPVPPGTQVALTPGTHVVEVTAGGQTRREELTVKAGERRAARPGTPVPAPALVAAPVAAPAPAVTAPPPLPVPVPASRRKTTAGVVLLAGGAAVLAAGAIGTGWAVGVWQQGERQRPGGPDHLTPSLTESEYRRAATVYPVSITAGAIGAAAALAGGLWVMGTF